MKIPRKLAIAVALWLPALTGCYIVPMAADGTPIWTAVPPNHFGSAPQPAPGAPARPAVLNARLYPANELATQTGVVTGTVTNMMSGKGRFQVSYGGDTLTGEATRVSGDERKGVASAYGANGAFMSCDYQMNTPYQGAGNCTFHNGARYQLHVGN
jgi:hypothetical protein